MPKMKKIGLDLVDLEILATIRYIGEGTATSLEKILGISRATISDRLKSLSEEEFLSGPEIDISSDRLKKVYKLNRSKFEDVVVTLHGVLNMKLSSVKVPVPVEDVRQIFVDALFSLSSQPARVLKKLKSGVNLVDLIEGIPQHLFIFTSSHDSKSSHFRLSPLSVLLLEISNLIEVKNGVILLTDQGVRDILRMWLDNIFWKIKELKEFISNERALQNIKKSIIAFFDGEVDVREISESLHQSLDQLLE